MTQKEREHLKMKVIYRARGKIFYFDNNEKYCSLPENEITQDTCNQIERLLLTADNLCTHELCPYEYGCNNGQIAIMALSRLREGDTIDYFEELLSTCKPAPKGSKKPIGLDAFICKIDKPIFYRSPDNLKSNTFDYIYVDVSILSTNAMKNRDKYLEEHIKEIRQRVAEKLKNSDAFKKYGVPINFLRVCRTTLKRKSNVLQFVFELKLS